MQVKLLTNPFDDLFNAIKHIYPDVKAEVVLVERGPEDPDTFAGSIHYPENNLDPILLEVFADQHLYDIIETVIYQLANAIVGEFPEDESNTSEEVEYTADQIQKCYLTYLTNRIQ